MKTILIIFGIVVICIAGGEGALALGAPPLWVQIAFGAYGVTPTFLSPVAIVAIVAFIWLVRATDADADWDR